MEKTLQRRLSTISQNQLSERQELQDAAKTADNVREQQQIFTKKVAEVQTLMDEMRHQLEEAETKLKSIVRAARFQQTLQINKCLPTFTNVYRSLPMIFSVYQCLPMILPMFTNVYQSLPMFLPMFLPIFTNVYQCFPMFTEVYQRLPMFTNVYRSLPMFLSMFTNVYRSLTRVYGCLGGLTSAWCSNRSFLSEMLP